MFDDPERSAWDRPGLDQIAWEEESLPGEIATTAVKEAPGGEEGTEELFGFTGAIGLRADGRRRADDDDAGELEEDYDDEEFDDDEDEVDDDFDEDFDEDEDLDDGFDDDFDEDDDE